MNGLAGRISASDSTKGADNSTMGTPADETMDAVSAVTLATLLVAEPERGDAALADMAPNALRAIRTHLGMDVAFVAEFTEGQRIFRHVDAAADDTPVREGEGHPLEESYCQRVIDGRLPELITDACALPAALELPITRALPLGAHLSVPIRLKDGRVYGTFCCFSYTPDHSLNDRDIAMMRVFADLTADQLDRELERDRRVAEVRGTIQAVIAGDGLSIVFQPIIHLGRGQLIGLEALARFAGAPPRGPDVWFAQAAAAGLGVELELAAIELAFAALPELPPDVYLAVNASPDTVTSGRLGTAFAGISPDRIVLEITEHSVIPSYEDLAAALLPLRALGVRIAVDDAGAGYSSFRHILRLQPDVIKLDMTLTRDIHRDPARRALATALIAFARDTGSDIVAEGVETDGELRTLQGLGVTAAQGYHLGRPGPLAVLADQPNSELRNAGTPNP